MNFGRTWLQSALLAAALSGCASPPRNMPEAAGGDQIYLSGRLSVQGSNPYSGRPEGGNASFELRGTPVAGELSLSTPLGTLLGRARWSAGEVWLQTSDGERRYDSLEALTQDLLGGAIPVAALFDWLRGHPWDGEPHAPLLDGALSTPVQGFTQLGWQIDLTRFSDGLIVARRLQEPVVTLRARLDP